MPAAASPLVEQETMRARWMAPLCPTEPGAPWALQGLCRGDLAWCGQPSIEIAECTGRHCPLAGGTTLLALEVAAPRIGRGRRHLWKQPEIDVHRLKRPRLAARPAMVDRQM